MRSPRLHPSAAPVQSEADIEPDSSPPSYRGLRIAYWCVALALGAADAWASRFSMNSDGVSYLDIGDAYWRGDWHNAINAYWSPLYSWILGFFLKVVNPSAYWEYPLVHLVNFLIYVAALACLEFFVMAFIEDRRRRDQELLKEGQMGLPESSWWLLSYSLFVSSSVILIGLGPVTPDMCVAAFVYLASGLILKIRAGAGRGTYIGLGVVLGLSYLAKEVMFPFSLVFLGTALLARGFSKQSVRNVATAALAFFILAGPFIVALSYAKSRPTIGETGAWVYSVYVDHVPYWAPDAGRVAHPMNKLLSDPPTYEFAGPIGGTFPPWYDPAYWHDGIKPYFALHGEIEAIQISFALYRFVFLRMFLSVLIGVVILIAISPWIVLCLQEVCRNWIMLAPALAALALYSLIHVEFRFIGAFAVLIWLGLYSGAIFPANVNRRHLAQFTVAAVSATAILFATIVLRIDWVNNEGPVFAEAAAALHNEGIHAGDRLGMVWNEQWNGGAAQGPFVPRLLKAKIAAEETDADQFWRSSDSSQRDVLEKLRRAGVKAVLTHAVPAAQQRNGWKQLGHTDYFAYTFTQNSAP